MLLSILLYAAFIILSCIVIWRASDGFETASEYLGRNLSEGVRGATINAVGSSMPEFFTTILFLFVLAGGDGFAGGIGTSAGSAVFNGVIIPALVILVVVGAGLASGVSVSKKVVLRDGIALIIGEILLILFIGGEQLTWWHGGILMLVYVVYVFYMLTTMRRNQKRASAKTAEKIEKRIEEEVSEPQPIGKAIFTLHLEHIFARGSINSGKAWALLLASMAVIGAACYLLVFSCEKLGHVLEIPVYFVAVILAAAATSVPDTILSVRDARKGNYDDAVSNAIGSNVFDICFAIGLPLMIYTIVNGGPIILRGAGVDGSSADNVVQLQMMLLVITIVAVALFYFGKQMGKLKAYALLGLYVLFLAYIFGDPEAELFTYSADISDRLNAFNEMLRPLRFWQ